MFEALFAVASFVAGAIASVSGFGIGSILTPFLTMRAGARFAVAATSIPHFVATLMRFWILRKHVDRRVLLHFGILSATGGLAGALLYSAASSRALTAVFAILLTFAGLTQLTGYSGKMRFGSKVAWIAGALSGMLGGLVGNQGGIRAAALMGFHLDRHAFVATATAIGLVVDIVRMPVYLITTGNEIAVRPALIIIGTAGALAGTFFGMKVLRGLPERLFHRIVGTIILALGLFMTWQALYAE